MKETKFIITWEVCWTPDDSEEERTEYTETIEEFDEDDGVESVEDFLEVSEEMFEDDRFDPESTVDQYLEEGGDVNIEYVKICDEDDNELWRDPDYKGE